MKKLQLDGMEVMGRMMDATIHQTSQLKWGNHAKLRIAKNLKADG
jgi:hypothetical protein